MRRSGDSGEFDEEMSPLKPPKLSVGTTSPSTLAELNLARPLSDRGGDQRGFSNEHRLFRSAPAGSSAFPSETTLNQRVPFL